MKNVITIIFLLFALSLSAQEDLNNFATQNKKFDVEMKSIDLPKNIESISIRSYDLKPASIMDLYFLYNSHIYDLKPNLSYMLYSNNNILKGIGGVNEAGGIFFYNPTNKLAFTFGGSAIKYSMNGRIYNDLVFSANLTYRVSNWLKLYLYGQYSLNAYANSMAGGYSLSPQNSYGAGAIIGIANKEKYSIDLNVGIESAHNPLNGKWELIYYCTPEITLKKSK